MGRDKKPRHKKESTKNENAGKKQKKANIADGNSNHNDHDASWRAPAANKEGCVCPAGCLIGKKITVNDVIGLGAANHTFVKVVCSNVVKAGKCDIVPFMHDVCFDKWEQSLMQELRMRRVTVDWNDEKVRRHLWLTDGGTYVHRSRKCSCGGALSRVEPEDENLPKPTEKAEKNAAKAVADPGGLKKKHLPPLVLSTATRAGGSIYKTCPGYSARGIAASYASMDYGNKTNRVRNRPEEPEPVATTKLRPWSPPFARPQTPRTKAGKKSTNAENRFAMGGASELSKPFSVEEQCQAVASNLAKGDSTRGPSRATSFSSSVDELENLFGSYQRQARGGSASNGASVVDGRSSRIGVSARSSVESSANGHVSSDDEDAGFDADTLVGEIRDLLQSLGGRLDLENEYLSKIVGVASGELMLSICDAGGLGEWLRSFPEFDVANGRVRLCRNVKREPIRLQTYGVVQTITDTEGEIFCPGYECAVYVGVDATGFEELRKGDSVRVEAIHSRASIGGHHYKALTVSVLQREGQTLPISGEDQTVTSTIGAATAGKQFPSPAACVRRRLFSDEEEDQPAARDNDGPWFVPKKRGMAATAPKSLSNQVVNGVRLADEKPQMPIAAGLPQDIGKNEGKPAESLADMVAKLTAGFMSIQAPVDDGGYGNALAMVQSWGAGIRGRENK